MGGEIVSSTGGAQAQSARSPASSPATASSVSVFTALGQEFPQETRDLAAVASVLDSMLADFDARMAPLAKASDIPGSAAVRRVMSFGASELLDSVDKMRSEFQEVLRQQFKQIALRRLLGESLDTVIAEYPALYLALGSGGIRLDPGRASEDVLQRYSYAVKELRALGDTQGMEYLAADLLQSEMTGARSRIPHARQAELWAEAENAARAFVQSAIGDTSSRGETALAATRDAFLKVLTFREASKSFDGSTLQGAKRDIWEDYRDAVNPRGEWFNPKDETWAMVRRETAINVPLLIGSGFVGSVGRSAFLAAVRREAGEVAAKRITTRVAAGLVEGATFETAYQALQGQWIGDLPDWGQRILWASATLGMFRGLGQVGERAFSTPTAVEGQRQATWLGEQIQIHITNAPVREAAKQLLVKGHVEAAGMLLVGAAQHGAYNGDISEFFKNFGDEVVTSYATVAGLKIGHVLAKPVEKGLKEWMNNRGISEKQQASQPLWLARVRDQTGALNLEGPAAPDLGREARITEALTSLDNYIREHETNPDARTLRSRQFRTIKAIQDALEHGETKGYMKLPTGYGKTVVFSELVEALNLKGRTLIVVPTGVLMEQTIEKLQKFGGGLTVGRVDKSSKDFDQDVTVTTYQSLIRGVETGRIRPEQFDLLVLDEGHKSLGPRTQRALSRFSDSIILGFTATPGGLKDVLPNQIDILSIREGVEEGLLSQFQVIAVKTTADLSNVRVKEGDLDPEQLEKAINTSARNKAAVQMYLQRFAGDASVSFVNSVAHGEAVIKEFESNPEFKAKKYRAVIVSGETPPKVREQIFRDFHEGRIQVLVSADLLIEGFDEPRATVAFNLRPTLSPIVAEQRAGRVLRLDADTPGKIATIVEFVDHVTAPERRPILFSDVAADAVIIPPGRPGSLFNERAERTSERRNLPELEGFQVIVEPEQVLALGRAQALERRSQELEEIDAKERQLRANGWLPLAEFRRQTGLTPVVLGNEIERATKQQDGAQLLDSIGRRTWVSPTLIEEVTQRRSFAPAGWLTQNQIKASYDIPLDFLARVFSEQSPKRRAEVSQEGVVRRGEEKGEAYRGQRARHYSPAFVTEVVERFKLEMEKLARHEQETKLKREAEEADAHRRREQFQRDVKETGITPGMAKAETVRKLVDAYVVDGLITPADAREYVQTGIMGGPLKQVLKEQFERPVGRPGANIPIVHVAKELGVPPQQLRDFMLSLPPSARRELGNLWYETVNKASEYQRSSAYERVTPDVLKTWAVNEEFIRRFKAYQAEQLAQAGGPKLQPLISFTGLYPPAIGEQVMRELPQAAKDRPQELQPGQNAMTTSASLNVALDAVKAVTGRTPPPSDWIPVSALRSRYGTSPRFDSTLHSLSTRNAFLVWYGADGQAVAFSPQLRKSLESTFR